MRVFAALLCLVPFVAQAASPAESYISARDRYVAQFKPKNGAVPDEKTNKAEERARADLEKQLRRIVGPAPKGTVGEQRDGQLNLQTLIDGDMGFGQLDGLVYMLKGETRVVVTTRALLANWLAAHKAWGNGVNVPAEPQAALQSEPFYTQAISSDAAVSHFATIPVTHSAGFATAMLAISRQDIGLTSPRDILIGMMSGDKVTVISAPAAPEIKMIPACEAVWKASEAKAQTIYDRYKGGDLKDEKLFDNYTKAQEDGDAAMRKCFAERAPAAPFFAAARKQAQELVDRFK